jgi:outer membrane protein TolC
MTRLITTSLFAGRALRTAILVCALAATARGQEPKPPQETTTLTLEEALRRAVESSNSLAEAAARHEAAEAVIGRRHADVLPNVSAQAGYTRTNHVDEFGVPLPSNQVGIIYPDIPDNLQTRLDLRWPIYTAGRLNALERAARFEASAVASDRDAHRSDVRLEVTRVYWALVTAIETERVVGQSVEQTGAHLRVVRSQLDAGVVAPNDVFTVEAQESRQRMLHIRAASNRETVEAELARLIGATPGTPIRPVALLEAPPPATALVDALVAAAVRQRPERAALLQRIQAADERTTAAAAGAKPTVSVQGGVDYARPNPRIPPRKAAWEESWDAGVLVQWPLFDGGRTKAERTEAEASARAIRARLADFDSTLAVELRQRLSELRAGLAAIDAGADGVRAATEARRVAAERFAAGVATSTDVLDAQVALLQAELDRTQAIANTRLAEARLARALGVAPVP